MMCLQQIIFCSQIQRILIDKEVCLSEYDSFLIKAFEKLEQSACVPEKQYNNHRFVTNYKINFVKAYREFYLIYKKIIQQWELYALDINTIAFADISCIKTVLDAFDHSYYGMMKTVAAKPYLSISLSNDNI